MRSDRRRAAQRAVWLAVALMVAARPVRADAGVPTFAAIWPPAWLLLLAIIPLEALVAMRVMRLAAGRALRMSTCANLFSTMLGLPLTWIGLVFVEMFVGGFGRPAGGAWQRIYAVTVESPWMMPDAVRVYWMIPVATMVLCIPFFFASVLTEYWIARLLVPREARRDAVRWAWLANLASYGMVELLLVVILLCSRR